MVGNSMSVSTLPPKDERSAIFEVRVKRGLELKEEGNAAYKTKQYQTALELYRRAIYQVNFGELSFNFELMDQHRSQVVAVQLPLYLNAAACTLHLEKIEPKGTETNKEEDTVLADIGGKKEGGANKDEIEKLKEVADAGDETTEIEGKGEAQRVNKSEHEHEHEVEDEDEDAVCDNFLDETMRLCGLALKLEPNNAKALYRRAQAYHRHDNPERAMEDLKAAVAAEPTDAAVRKLYEVVRRDIAANMRQQQNFWKKSFEKNSSNDTAGGNNDNNETVVANDESRDWTQTLLLGPWMWLMALCRRTRGARSGNRSDSEDDNDDTDADGADIRTKKSQ